MPGATGGNLQILQHSTFYQSVRRRDRRNRFKQQPTLARVAQIQQLHLDILSSSYYVFFIFLLLPSHPRDFRWEISYPRRRGCLILLLSPFPRPSKTNIHVCTVCQVTAGHVLVAVHDPLCNVTPICLLDSSQVKPRYIANDNSWKCVYD